MSSLSKIPPSDYKLDHEFQKHPPRKLEFLGHIISQLMEWNQDENLIRKNESSHIQKVLKIEQIRHNHQ